MNTIELCAAATGLVPNFGLAEPTRRPRTNARSMRLVQRSGVVRSGPGPLAALLRGGGLYPVYQPIVSLRDGGIYSHEALIRGPQGTEFHTPDVLLALAAREGLNFEFESSCAVAALDRWALSLNQGGCL